MHLSERHADGGLYVTSAFELSLAIRKLVTEQTDVVRLLSPPTPKPWGNSEQVAHQPEMGGLGMPKSPIFSR